MNKKTLKVRIEAPLSREEVIRLLYNAVTEEILDAFDLYSLIIDDPEWFMAGLTKDQYEELLSRLSQYKESLKYSPTHSEATRQIRVQGAPSPKSKKQTLADLL